MQFELSSVCSAKVVSRVERCGKHRVARLMRQEGCVRRRATTDARGTTVASSFRFDWFVDASSLAR